jgi:hypothetical protein
MRAEPQESHSNMMLLVWPSRQRAAVAKLKLLHVLELFVAAVTDEIKACGTHARRQRTPLSQGRLHSVFDLF